MTFTMNRDRIAGISGHPMSGLWTLAFESGRMTHIESGYGVRQLASCFGASEGSGDLLEKITGQDIYWSEDGFGIFAGFTPADDWTLEPLEIGESREFQDEEEVADHPDGQGGCGCGMPLCEFCGNPGGES